MPGVATEQRPVSAEVALFLVVGITTAAAYLLVAALLTTLVGLTPTVSAAIAFVLLIPPHFASHSRLVFRHGAFSPAIVLRYALALSTSMVLNVGLVAIYWRYFLAPPLSAQALAVIPMSIASFILFKYVVFRDRPISLSWRGLEFLIPAATTAIACVALYAAIAAMLLYTKSILHADDWRIYNDYFFARDLWDSVFGRQNGHLIVPANAIFLANYTFLGGGMAILSIINVCLLGTAGAIGAYVADQVLSAWQTPGRTRVAVASTLLALGLILLAPVTQFWGLGIHNALVVFGVAGAAFMASGHAGRLSKPSTAAGYVLFALIASTSFSTGTAAWALGFAGAIVARERALVSGLYLALGVTMGLLTLGVSVFESSAAVTSLSLSTVVQFVPAFLGNGPWEIRVLPPDHAARFFYASIIGFMGLTLYGLLTLRVMARWVYREETTEGFGYTYLWLLASFAVLAAALVAVGRSKSDLGVYAALYPRFATWSALFWVSLVAAGALAILDLSRRSKLSGRVARLSILVVAALILAVNLRLMSTRVASAFNYSSDSITQVAVNREHERTRVNLWRPDKWPIEQRVIADMRAKKRNIFLWDWPHFMGTKAVSRALAKARAVPCHTYLRFFDTSKDNEWKVRGYAVPGTSGPSPLEVLFFINHDGVVVGFALPVFGSPARNAQSASVFQTILQSLPLLSRAPGVSGAFVGTVRHQAGDDAYDFVVAGRDRVGSWCVQKGR
jgi:putative flippase GtrA